MTTLTWETASDWDSAQSEDGVVHESVANTDHDDDTLVQKGYSVPSPLFSADLANMYLFHEDSGTTLYDLIGTDDGTITGAGPAATGTVDGILAGSAYDFDGSDDRIDLNAQIIGSTATVIMWCYLPSPSPSANENMLSNHLSDFPYALQHEGNDQFRMQWNDTTWQDVVAPEILDEWFHIAGVRDQNGVAEIYTNGTLQDSSTVGDLTDKGDRTTKVGEINDGGDWWSGYIGGLWHYNAVLSDTQIQQHYDVVNTLGSLTTATKTA